MKSSAKKVELASVDDLFSTEESRADAQREKVLEIPLSELHPFKDHPFKVKDDEAMMETADSIRQYGVLVPAIARPDPNGGYELVAGHRRHRASELAGKGTILVECGKMLQRGAPKLGKDGKPVKDKNGKVIYEPYQIRVLNTINSISIRHNRPGRGHRRTKRTISIKK